jgi:hypothetical protein
MVMVIMVIGQYGKTRLCVDRRMGDYGWCVKMLSMFDHTVNCNKKTRTNKLYENKKRQENRKRNRQTKETGRELQKGR